MQLFAILLLLAPGCSGPRDYFPMEVGRTWTYRVRAGLAISVEDVKVLRRMAVADTVGYEVGGPLGLSRLAWKGRALVADSLPNTRVSPPLPLLVPGDADTASEADAAKPGARFKPVRTWRGTVETMGKSTPARAELFQEEATLAIATRKYQTIKATLRLQTAGKNFELTAWYADGIGLVRQEQQTNGLQDVAMEFLGGP